MTIRFGLCCIVAAQVAWAGEFKKAYYGGTPVGGWSQLRLTDKAGTVSDFTYERKPDADGRVVLALSVKTTSGAAAGSESAMTYTMPRGFDLANNGHSYGKFVEKMTMAYGDMETPVDDATLEVIRQAEKDFRGRVTFTGTETIGALTCDRYTYAFSDDTSRETGTLWLNETIPFALVKQTGRIADAGGTITSDFAMELREHGQSVIAEETPEVEAEPEPPAQPITTTLGDGFRSGHIGLDVEALAGGKQLRINLRNETEAQMTVKLEPGPLDLEVGFPVRTLRIQIDKAQQLILPGGASSDPLVVKQRGIHGIAEGTGYLSIYEGTPVFQGSVTMDQLPK